jgi:hypothetical protein
MNEVALQSATARAAMGPNRLPPQHARHRICRRQIPSACLKTQMCWRQLLSRSCFTVNGTVHMDGNARVSSPSMQFHHQCIYGLYHVHHASEVLVTSLPRVARVAPAERWVRAWTQGWRLQRMRPHAVHAGAP